MPAEMAFHKGARVIKASRKGEVVIPADIRRELGIEDGGRVSLAVVEGRLVLDPEVGLGTQLWGKYQAESGAPSTEQVLQELDDAGEIP